MKIINLIENTTHKNNLLCEHGLSILIQTLKHNILFDTGQTGDFIKNSQAMGIDLKKIDIVVISHSHYDHTGGLNSFLEINDTAKIYINQNCVGDFLNGDKYIGIDKNILDDPRIIFTKDIVSLDDNIFLMTCNQCEKIFEMPNDGLSLKLGDNIYSDPFLHEQYLLIKENNKSVLITGCSHKGLPNIMEWTKYNDLDIVIGGFHLKNIDTQESNTKFLVNFAKQLQKFSCTYYTCHCTGLPQYSLLKNIMYENLQYFSTGDELIV